VGHRKSNIDRLLSAFCLEEPDRVPNLKHWITSREVKEYVLGRSLKIDPDTWTTMDPKDEIEIAQRISMDAVGVYFSWGPAEILGESSNPLTRDNYLDGVIKDWDDLEEMGEPPDIAEDLSVSERYLTASRGTNVGVFASLTSFFDGTRTESKHLNKMCKDWGEIETFLKTSNKPSTFKTEFRLEISQQSLKLARNLGHV